MRITRRKFLATFLFGGTACGADMALIEPHALGIGRHTVPLGGGANQRPLKLLHISDLHASNCVSLDFIERGIDLGLSLEPDFICVTGDFITRLYEDWDRYAQILAKLSRTAPTFACLGNHDGGPWISRQRRKGYEDASHVRGMIARAGIELLYNTSRRFEIGGRALTLAGVGDLWNRELFADQAFAKVGAERTPTILLCHNPDAKTKVLEYPWDLMLSGHTHGGQLRLPFLGTPFAPVRDHRFVEGLHHWEGRWLHITKGIGNLHGLRFNCRPEVSLLTLT